MRIHQMKGAPSFLLSVVVIVSMVNTACSAEDIPALGGRRDGPPSGYVIKFERKGGYFGWQDTFWIYPDGRVVNTSGKTARIPSELVRQWMQITEPDEVPVDKKKPSMLSVSMDCYIYRITVYAEGETSVLSSSCTDTYPLDRDKDDDSAIDIGQMRNTLMTLPYK